MKRFFITIAMLIAITSIVSAQEKILIAYYSLSNNTARAAEIIQRLTGADLFRIEGATRYPGGSDVALRQQRKDARPALSATVPNFDQYDTIILGWPNWWAAIPMYVETFLDSYDFTGKTIMPFSSHGGGLFAQAISYVCKSAPSSIVTNGYNFSYGSSSESAIRQWLNDNGITTR
jgi:flavodoxin